MAIGKILLSALALTLGVLTSAYFFIWWWQHRDGQHARALLLWSIALFLMYWYQIPAILFSLKKVIVVTDFNLFFSLTFPITFLALILIYLGILQIQEIQLEKNTKFVLLAWFVSAILFFAYHFIIRGGVIETYSLPLVGNIIFYLPIRALIIFVVGGMFFSSKPASIYGVLGASGVIIESILGLTRNLFIIKNVLIYPPQFWYMTIAASRFFFITQTISVIVLVFGFYFLHAHYHRLRYGNN